MASQERLSVEEAAARLGITPDAVRSRIKRGSLWAVRRNGRVLVVLDDAAEPPRPQPRVPQSTVARLPAPPRPAEPPAAGDRPGAEPRRSGAPEPEGLHAALQRARARIGELERERARHLAEIDRQARFIELEYALRARLQDQIDALSRRVAAALPEPDADPVEGADRLWRRLERQVTRANRNDSEDSR